MHFRPSTSLRNMLVVGLAVALLPLAACGGEDKETLSDAGPTSTESASAEPPPTSAVIAPAETRPTSTESAPAEPRPTSAVSFNTTAPAPNISQPTGAGTAPDQTSSTGRIVFASIRDGIASSEIYVINADGSGVTRLTNSPFDEDDPEWSPNGTMIAFASTRGGNLGEIYVMNADGSQQTRVTWTPGVASLARQPAWSRRGKAIAYTTQGGLLAVPQFRIRITRAIADLLCDPDAKVLLDTDWELPNQDRLLQYMSPAWSLGDSSMAFSQIGGAAIFTVQKIAVMDVDGTGLVELTDRIGPEDQPAWSPDGSKIAYQSNENIFVINADGSGRVQLTTNSADNAVPTWSPDGSEIAFHSDRDGGHEIYVMNADGTDVRRLTQSGGSNPDWSPALQSENPVDVCASTQSFDISPTAPLHASNIRVFFENPALFGVPKAQREVVLRELQAVMDTGQQVLDCQYGPLYPDKNEGFQSYGYWYGEVPDNFLEIRSLAPNIGFPFVLAHLGTNSITSCPETLELAEKVWNAGRPP